jgi:ArsR family transcriptional regulator
MKSFIRAMKALSAPNRLKIMKMLQKRVCCVCEIQEALDIAQPTVSKHLKVLEDAGLVSPPRAGLWMIYSLTGGRSSPCAASFMGNGSTRVLSKRT